ncbi:DUF4149 domain-containing protein [Pseudomonas mangiferae]|uniref:DUF4149 domain-containing protein n=1 Tax=Pseudomonas mangiferae TaxID=2593654 RepID=A0A553GXR3_9PSED|nr:DUF4149 domain-containing protein [Pseudomonas mangiferae]
MVACAWRLALVFWVGGLWLLHFVVLPGLERFGLASLLVDDIAGGLRPLLMAFAGACAVVQGGLLVLLGGRRALWQDSRGQLVMICLAAVLVFFAVRQVLPGAEYATRFCYLVAAFAGALLAIRETPGAEPGSARTGAEGIKAR